MRKILLASALALFLLALVRCSQPNVSSAPPTQHPFPSAQPPACSSPSPLPPTPAPPAPDKPKYTYVIIHGAWAGGWEWKKVGDLLTADGHIVYRPTLTGQGERVHLASPDIDLDTHIMDIVNVIRFENLHDVVLVAHSYGGMVATGVADKIPERLKCMIYVDAFLPEDGESLNTIGGGGGRGRGGGLQGVNGMVNLPGAATPPANREPPYDVPQSAKTFSQPVSRKNPAALKIPTTYILTVDRGQQPQQDTFYRYYQRAQARGWNTLTMEGDHVVSMTHPTETAALLESEVAKAKATP